MSCIHLWAGNPKARIRAEEADYRSNGVRRIQSKSGEGLRTLRSVVTPVGLEPTTQ